MPTTRNGAAVLILDPDAHQLTVSEAVGLAPEVAAAAIGEPGHAVLERLNDAGWTVAASTGTVRDDRAVLAVFLTRSP